MRKTLWYDSDNADLLLFGGIVIGDIVRHEAETYEWRLGLLIAVLLAAVAALAIYVWRYIKIYRDSSLNKPQKLYWKALVGPFAIFFIGYYLHLVLEML